MERRKGYYYLHEKLENEEVTMIVYHVTSLKKLQMENLCLQESMGFSSDKTQPLVYYMTDRRKTENDKRET